VSLVIDSSITLSWCFEDERTDVTTTLLYRVAETGALVPALWRLEVANGLQVAVRRGRIDAAYRDATIGDLRDLAIDLDPETDRKAWSEILQLADRFRLTLYDAAYLELAQRRQLRGAAGCSRLGAGSAARITIISLSA
jgi:predicted nucleic acid-binding protein